ncbi:MAG: cation diffusion facilitator family transporter, partial [Ectothiorhodospiraceae bacterium]
MAAAHNHDHGHDHSHDHGHGHDHDHEAPAGRALVLGLTITGAFAIVELVGGWLSGSLALMGDAGHMATDTLALGLGALAARLSRRPPSGRHTFGLQRAEIVGALINGAFMLAVVVAIGYEAVHRFFEPAPVQGGMVLIVAGVGLLVNLMVLKVLHGGSHDLNTRGAILHVIGDLLGSVAALGSGLVITLTGWTPIDPILSLFISALILLSTARLLHDAVHVVMEGVPGHIDLAEVGRRLARVEGVLDVHDLHVWTIASGSHAIAAHVRVESLEHWPEQLKVMEQLLRDSFQIDHVTL